MILRGKDVEHHNVVNDMMLSQEITYRPQPGADGVPKDNVIFHNLVFNRVSALAYMILNYVFLYSDGCYCDYRICEGCHAPY